MSLALLSPPIIKHSLINPCPEVSHISIHPILTSLQWLLSSYSSLVPHLSTTISKADISNKYMLSSNFYSERSPTVTLVIRLSIFTSFSNISILPDRSPSLPPHQHIACHQLSEIIEYIAKLSFNFNFNLVES